GHIVLVLIALSEDLVIEHDAVHIAGMHAEDHRWLNGIEDRLHLDLPRALLVGVRVEAKEDFALWQQVFLRRQDRGGIIQLHLFGRSNCIERVAGPAANRANHSELRAQVFNKTRQALLGENVEAHHNSNENSNYLTNMSRGAAISRAAQVPITSFYRLTGLTRLNSGA